MLQITQTDLEKQKETLFAELAQKLDTINQLPTMQANTLSPTNTAIISVDVNNGFAISGSLCSKRVENLIAPTAEFLRLCKQNNFPVMAYSDYHTESSPEIAIFPPHCMENTAEYLIPEEIAKHCDTIVYKNSTNAFLAKSPLELFPDARNFVITGCLTDICIFQFVASLRAYLNQHNMNDYSIIIPLDLIDTYDAPGHNALLYNIMYISGLLENGISVVKKISF